MYLHVINQCYTGKHPGELGREAGQLCYHVTQGYKGNYSRKSNILIQILCYCYLGLFIQFQERMHYVTQKYFLRCIWKPIPESQVELFISLLIHHFTNFSALKSVFTSWSSDLHKISNILDYSGLIKLLHFIGIHWHVLCWTGKVSIIAYGRSFEDCFTVSVENAASLSEFYI